MEDDDGFTFPSPVAAAALPPSSHDGLLWPRLPTASSNLWPFSCTTTTADDAGAAGKEAAPASSESGGTTAVAARRDEEEEEERMDILWEHARAREERMDLLWEDFNDELLLQLRRQRAAGTASPAADGGGGGGSSSPDEEETSTSSPPGGGGLYGCAPTMLRASSRAGAVGQFYGRRGRGGGSRATTGWELLLRLFRKLFAVDKSLPAPPCHHHFRHGSIYVP